MRSPVGDALLGVVNTGSAENGKALTWERLQPSTEEAERSLAFSRFSLLFLRRFPRPFPAKPVSAAFSHTSSEVAKHPTNYRKFRSNLTCDASGPGRSPAPHDEVRFENPAPYSPRD